jgi:hypothetical protein
MILVAAAQNSGIFPRTGLARNNPRFDDFNHLSSRCNRVPVASALQCLRHVVDIPVLCIARCAIRSGRAVAPATLAHARIPRKAVRVIPTAA